MNPIEKTKYNQQKKGVVGITNNIPNLLGKKVKLENTQRIGNITFNSDTARKSDSNPNVLIVKGSDGKDYGVTRNSDGSYKHYSSKEMLPNTQKIKQTSNSFLRDWYANREIKDGYWEGTMDARRTALDGAIRLDGQQYLQRANDLDNIKSSKKYVDKIPGNSKAIESYDFKWNFNENPNITPEKEHIFLLKKGEPYAETKAKSKFMQREVYGENFAPNIKNAHTDILSGPLKSTYDFPKNSRYRDFLPENDYNYRSVNHNVRSIRPYDTNYVDEIHNKIMILRQKAGFKPKQFIDEKTINNFFDQYKNNNGEINDLLKVTRGREAIRYLLNRMVSNDNKSKYNTNV